MSKHTLRDSSIESLRIILILFVVGFHVIHNGTLHPEHPLRMGDSNFLNAVILDSFFVVAVNCFVLISGFFGINATKEKFVKLYGMVISYSVLLSVGFALYYHFSGSVVNYMQVAKSFVPVISKQWWFFTAYIILFLCAPILNLAINHFSKRQMTLLLGVAIFLFIIAPTVRMPIQLGRGFDFTHFIVLYFIGAYIKRYITIPRIKVSLIVYLFATLGIALFTIFLDSIGMNYGYISASYAYNNLLVVVAAIALFMVFMKINIGHHKVINNIAVMVFGVYLLHEHPDVKALLYTKIFHCNEYYHSTGFIANLVFTCLCVFVTGVVFEYLRQKTIAQPVDNVILKIMNGVESWFDKRFIK